MGVHIDEPGGDDLAVRSDYLSGFAQIEPDRGDHAVLDRDVGAARLCAGSVVDGSTPDDQIVL